MVGSGPQGGRAHPAPTDPGWLLCGHLSQPGEGSPARARPTIEGGGTPVHAHPRRTPGPAAPARSPGCRPSPVTGGGLLALAVALRARGLRGLDVLRRSQDRAPPARARPLRGLRPRSARPAPVGRVLVIRENP
jgi:hypothetical protein